MTNERHLAPYSLILSRKKSFKLLYSGCSCFTRTNNCHGQPGTIDILEVVLNIIDACLTISIQRDNHRLSIKELVDHHPCTRWSCRLSLLSPLTLVTPYRVTSVIPHGCPSSRSPLTPVTHTPVAPHPSGPSPRSPLTPDCPFLTSSVFPLRAAAFFFRLG